MERGTKFYQDFRADNRVAGEAEWWLYSDCPMCKHGGNCFHAYGSQFYCYKCKMAGDPVSYLMNTRKCSMSDAIIILAAWVGYEFPLPEADKSEVADRMSKEDSIKEAERLMKLVE